MKRLLLAVLAIIAAAYAVAVNWASATDATVDISAKTPAPLPFLFRAGVFTYAPVPPPEPLRLLTQDLKAGTVEFDLGRLAFRDAVDAADVLYRARILVPRLQAVREAGGEVVLAFTQIPLWLSSRSTSVQLLAGDILRVGNVSPPRDGTEWAALVQRVVQQMRSDLQFSPRYKVGWEPDGQSWQGTEAEFFTFYRDTAIGIRMGDPNAKVGGPSVSALYNGRGTEDPMLRRFIRYCAATPVSNLGWTRLPLDFLVWHQFESNHLTSWANAARQAKQWLADGGYSTGTELLIGEWSSWRSFPD
ncbi:MAG TPA: hypothetical protein VNT02_07795, partial [Burkholderiales bacterium]|nr:hypothetical protein [Burkholderiales bacterium]